MNLAKSGLVSFEYAAFDQATNLNVAADIYDITSTPAFVQRVTMPHVAGGVYAASFTALAGVNYLVVKRAFTSNTLVTPDPDRAPGSEALQSVNLDVSGIADVLVAQVAALVMATKVVNGLACGIKGEIFNQEIDCQLVVEADISC